MSLSFPATWLPFYINNLAILLSHDQLYIIRFGIMWGIKWHQDLKELWPFFSVDMLSKKVIGASLSKLHSNVAFCVVVHAWKKMAQFGLLHTTIDLLGWFMHNEIRITYVYFHRSASVTWKNPASITKPPYLVCRVVHAMINKWYGLLSLHILLVR